MSVVDGLPFAEEKKKYILEVLDPVLEEMVSDILTEMPRIPLEFMIAWLRKRSGAATSMRVSIRQKNLMLKQELKQITDSLEEAGTAIMNDGPADKEEEEEEEDDDNDEPPPGFFDKPPETKVRASVSAEAYGDWNTKKAFTPPQYPKSDEQKQRLNQTLTKSFMFSALEPADMETILLAVKECTYEPGAKIIIQGADGDCLYIIEKGECDCLVNIEGADKVVKTCAPGDVFGELALLYNCPRAATCVAKEAMVAWSLDRDCFNYIVKDAAVKKRAKYDAFLQSVALISSLGAYERSQIADALKPETFNRGDVIVKQDDPGDKFYIIEEGALYALKEIPGEGEKRVKDYQSGDCFGELALLKNQPRAASVIVQSDTAKVLSMTRLSFNKMLGPLQNILAKVVDTYK